MNLLILILSAFISLSSQQVTDNRTDLVDYSELISASITETEYVNYCEVNDGKESAEDLCHEYYVNEAYKDGEITKEKAIEFLKESSE